MLILSHVYIVTWLVISKLIFIAKSVVVSAIRLQPSKRLVLSRVKTPAVKTWHILIWIWVTVIIFLSEYLLLLLWSSIRARLLVYHERRLGRLILVIRLIEVWKVRLVVGVEWVLAVFESDLVRNWTSLILLLINAIRCPSQIINWLLQLLLLIREWIHRRWYNRLRILKWHVLIMTCFHHVCVLGESSRLHKIRILVIWTILWIFFIIKFSIISLLRSSVLISCKPLIMSSWLHTLLLHLALPIFCCAKRIGTPKLVVQSLHHIIGVDLNVHIISSCNFLSGK